MQAILKENNSECIKLATPMSISSERLSLYHEFKRMVCRVVRHHVLSHFV